ncbi:hypothetical protein QYE76_019351 [Lolium multiflorum]|uniref:Uncharacterized protein n=1 Tax=Lolium multiflorum TaxID=4521 RepID=A0AAD8VP09_LOLMU|nr:hypothetical protein QYE76_019351 [Lolium multiflorum]
MAVPGAKIAFSGVWTREEEANSRREPDPGPDNRTQDRPGRFPIRSTGLQTGPIRSNPDPRPVQSGPSPGASALKSGFPGRSTGPLTGCSGPQAGSTGIWTGKAADAVAVFSADDVLGIRCSRQKISSVILNDYLDIRKGVQRHTSELQWYLHHYASVEEYEHWEKNMELGFNRCRTYNKKFSGYDAYVLAHRRVDEELDNCWCDAVDRGDFACTWEDFKTFLRDGFVSPYMEESEQPSGVVHAIKEVGKCIVPIQEVVPLPTVTKGKVISSEEKEPGSDTKSTTVTVEEDVPLSGLNMQLKKVQDDACKTVDKRTLKPLGDDHIKSDVELLVRKEKLHKPKVQLNVHVVPSVDIGDVSAMHVDDKPVLVGDKPDEATLLDDVDVIACATVTVCVDASIQTDDICVDGVSVHMAQMRMGGVGGEQVGEASAVDVSRRPGHDPVPDLGSIKTSKEEGIGAEVQAHMEKKGGAKKAAREDVVWKASKT